MIGKGSIWDLKANSQLNDIMKYTTPIATYTYNNNVSAAVSAVDVATNRFTSVGHPFVNADMIYPVMNYDAGNIFPLNIYPGGIVLKSYPGYYVKKIDADTFELYSDSGLTTIVDITTNANMDLTKFHFEKLGNDLVISNLGNLGKVRFVIKGKTIRSSANFNVLPNNIVSASEWLISGGTAFASPALSITGDIYFGLEVIFNYVGYLSIRAKGLKIASNTISTNTQTLVDMYLVSPKYRDSVITSISFLSCYLANGTTVEVYKA